jgi:probable phosphoglycerate mutase
LLIRHATTDWVGRHFAGWIPGISLNEQGRGQAQALAERLVGTPLVAVYSSPLERAQETAAAIAAPHGLAVETVEAVGEVHCGDWTGQSIEELRQTELWRRLHLYPSGTRFPGGESMFEAQARMVAALDQLRTVHPGAIVAVVSHADPIKAAVAYYVGLHLDLCQRLAIGAASITELSFTPFGPRLLRCNDCAHNPPEI